MSIPWGLIKSLLLLFGPLLLPRALRLYRSLRAEDRQAGRPPVRPLPAPTLRALAVLAGVVLVLLTAAVVPGLAPENVFRATQSRLQVPTDVLFTRLAALRPGDTLTGRDEDLRARLVSLEGRLLYLKFGPAVTADCPFCRSDEPSTFFQYALPDLLAPHLFNLVVIAIVTSALFAPAPAGTAPLSPAGGPSPGARWRTAATLAAVGLAAGDVFLVNSWNHQANARALHLSDLYPFFWAMRAWRHAALGLLDALLAAVLWLTATNRLFTTPPSAAERVEAATRALASARSRLSAVGIVKNTAIRDEELRARGQAYWAHEVRLMREVMEEREVVDGVSDALQNRVDIRAISRDAEMYAQSVLPSAPIVPPPVPADGVPGDGGGGGGSPVVVE